MSTYLFQVIFFYEQYLLLKVMSLRFKLAGQQICVLEKINIHTLKLNFTQRNLRHNQLYDYLLLAYFIWNNIRPVLINVLVLESFPDLFQRVERNKKKERRKNRQKIAWKCYFCLKICLFLNNYFLFHRFFPTFF